MKKKNYHCTALCKAKIEDCLLIVAQSMRLNVTGTDSGNLCTWINFKEENK